MGLKAAVFRQSERDSQVGQHRDKIEPLVPNVEKQRDKADSIIQTDDEKYGNICGIKYNRTRGDWSPEMVRLIEWFLATPLPTEPFEMNSAVTIIHAGRYWEYLRGDIAAGPGRQRSYMGAFEEDLRRLYELFGPSPAEDELPEEFPAEFPAEPDLGIPTTYDELPTAPPDDLAAEDVNPFDHEEEKQ